MDRIRLTLPTHMYCRMISLLYKFRTFETTVAKRAKYYAEPISLKWPLLLTRIWIRGLFWDFWKPPLGGGGGCATATSVRGYFNIMASLFKLFHFCRSTEWHYSFFYISYCKWEERPPKIVVFAMHGNINKNSPGFECENVFSRSDLIMRENVHWSA